MSIPVLTFFNNKGGVGKTTLVYHLAWMLTELDRSVFVVDLDPQANLTAAFLDEDQLIDIFDEPKPDAAATIYQCVQPLTRAGDIRDPDTIAIPGGPRLLPGDLKLSGFEENLSTEWPNCLGSGDRYRPFRVTTAFWQVMQRGAKLNEADIVLVDVGPSLGALNRSALIATDYVVVPLAADLFSRQGLRNLGPALTRWRAEWQQRRANWEEPEFDLPNGSMRSLGYLIQQPGIRLSRPVKAYDRWVKQMPAEYASSGLVPAPDESTRSQSEDRNEIAVIKHYRSLIPLGQEARKPIFSLAAGDGAIGGHAAAARYAGHDFRRIALEILRRMEAAKSEPVGLSASAD